MWVRDREIWERERDFGVTRIEIARIERERER